MTRPYNPGKLQKQAAGARCIDFTDGLAAIPQVLTSGKTLASWDREQLSRSLVFSAMSFPVHLE